MEQLKLSLTKSSSTPDEASPPNDVDSTLAARGAKYGTFKTQAMYAETMNKLFAVSPNWDKMEADSKEALRIIANKIGRILNGDPEYDDNWRDIAGYATLVLNRINGRRQ